MLLTVISLILVYVIKVSTAPDETVEYTGFDYDRIVDNIYISGHKINLYSTTVADLGEDFSVDIETDPSEIINGDKKLVDLYYKSEFECYVFLILDKNNLKDSIISGIFCHDYKKESNLSVDGIKLGDEIEKVIKKYGEPDSIMITPENSDGTIYSNQYRYYQIDEDFSNIFGRYITFNEGLHNRNESGEIESEILAIMIV